jgi:hypothetical protein
MIWTFPVKLAQGKHLIPTFAVAGATAAPVPLDPPVARFFRETASHSQGSMGLSRRITQPSQRF